MRRFVALDRSRTYAAELYGPAMANVMCQADVTRRLSIWRKSVTYSGMTGPAQTMHKICGQGMAGIMRGFPFLNAKDAFLPSM